MAFKEVRNYIKYSNGLSERYKLLDAYEKLLAGTLYDSMPHSFNEEWVGESRIPLDERRPSVIFNIAHFICQEICIYYGLASRHPK